MMLNYPMENNKKTDAKYAEDYIWMTKINTNPDDWNTRYEDHWAYGIELHETRLQGLTAIWDAINEIGRIVIDESPAVRAWKKEELEEWAEHQLFNINWLEFQFDDWPFPWTFSLHTEELEYSLVPMKINRA